MATPGGPTGGGSRPAAAEPVAIGPWPGDVRRFGHDRHGGVAEAGPSGRLRLDAIARWVQDVAWDDVEDLGLRDLTLWLVRRTRMRVNRFPSLGDRYALTTWVTGVGRMWAERRTDIVAEGASVPDVEVSSLWVHIDPERLLPSEVTPQEIAAWTGPATPRIRARLRHPAPPAGAARRPWTFRAAELDLAAHINNAAYLTPLDEELIAAGGPPASVDLELEYRSPVLAGPAEILSAGPRRWIADPGTGEVRASLLLSRWVDA